MFRFRQIVYLYDLRHESELARMVHHRVSVEESLPKTSTGKVNYQRLLQKG